MKLKPTAVLSPQLTKSNTLAESNTPADTMLVETSDTFSRFVTLALPGSPVFD
jgi:hypothetical protein